MHSSPRTATVRAARCAALGLACLLDFAGATADPPAASPLGGGQSVMLEPAPPPASPRRHRPVFVCQDGGVPVYADRPCGPDVAVRSLTVEAPGPGAAASTSPPAPRASTRPRTSSGKAAIRAAPPAEDRCARHRQRLDELDERMRAGYSARDAARLWQQWRDAKERLRAARC